MGHIRLGTLPRTRQWIQVLDLIGGGAGTPDVAAATMDASQHGLTNAAKDPGLVYTVWLLSQVPLAARSENFAARLRKLGLKCAPGEIYCVRCREPKSPAGAMADYEP